MTHKKQIDLQIEIDVLTSETTAEVVVAILESLLYQRNQIPFVYKTYRYYVNKWLEQKEKQSSTTDEGCDAKSFQLERKKHQATNTKEAISSMRQTIQNTFERKPVKSLRFLFGPTIFTAKESYTVHIPIKNIAINHFHNHHKISPTKLNQTLLSLLTSEELYAIFSHNLNPTNIYLELELLDNKSSDIISCKESIKKYDIFPKDVSPLPASCKDIHIHLLHKQIPNINDLKCCKELQIFEDIKDIINLSCENARQHEDKTNETLTNITPAWWEAEIVIRGFKDQPNKRLNLWS